MSHLAACVWHAQHIGLPKVAVGGEDNNLQQGEERHWQKGKGKG